MTDRAEEYQFYKNLGICVRCNKNAAEPNKVMCLECADKDSEYGKKKRNKNANELRTKDLNKYYELKSKGICTYCKKKMAMEDKTKCEKCLAKIRNKRHSKKCDIEHSERISYGICYICGKDKVMKGKGVCPKCYGTRMSSMRKIMYLPGNEQWKKDNKLIFNKKESGEIK